MICINESGLYSLILSSKLPSAKEFKRWVTSEVLPSIRQTGSYSSANMTMEDIIIYQMEQTKVFKLYLSKFSFKAICINFFTTKSYNCTLLIKNTVESKIER